jgi:hypothetical protein
MPPWTADPQYGHFRRDPRLSDDDVYLVTLIRRRCADAFDSPADYPFFSAHYNQNEHADVAIVRVFREEMAAQLRSGPYRACVESVLQAMIYG